MNFYLHLGYPKTGTTTLQNNFFARHPGVYYLMDLHEAEMETLLRESLYLDTVFFEERLPAYWDLVDRIAREAAALGRVPVLSHEGYLTKSRYAGHDLGRTMERLAAVFRGADGKTHQAHAIATIRSQPEMILSYFNEFVHGLQGGFDRYLDEAFRSGPGRVPPEPKSPPARDIFFMDGLFYDKVFDHMAKVFGRERMLVLLFEDFLADQSGYLATLSRFIGLDEAQGRDLLKGRHDRVRPRDDSAYRRNDVIQTLAMGPVRAFARWKQGTGLADVSLSRTAVGKAFFGVLRSMDKALPQGMAARRLALRPDQTRRIEDLYRASNTRMAERFGLPLKERGYAVDGSPA